MEGVKYQPYGTSEKKIDIVDEQKNPNISNPFNPYYDTYGKANSQSFFDLPVRYDIQDNNQWSANLYLVQQTAPKTVTIYNGISYGWSDVFTPQKPKKVVDLELLLDTTGSMSSYISSVQSSVEDILNQLDTSGVDYRIAIADYKDFPEQDGYPYRADLPFSTDETAINNTINSLTSDIGGGGDTPESAYSGLINSINTQGLGTWRDGATKATIILTDAPPHDPEPHTGYTAQDVINAALAVDPDQIYSIIPGGDPTAVSYFSKLSSATGGQLYTTHSGNDIANALLDITANITGSPINSDRGSTTLPDGGDGGSKSVPEPSSLIGLLIFGLGGFFLSKSPQKGKIRNL
jgi:hypothetical protein